MKLSCNSYPDNALNVSDNSSGHINICAIDGYEHQILGIDLNRGQCVALIKDLISKQNIKLSEIKDENTNI